MRGELACVGDDARVGGVDPGHVRVDLAGGAERCRERDGRRVGAATAERRHVLALGRDALEAGDEHDLAGVERGEHAVRPDVEDLRLAVRGVGDDPGLRARQRDGLVSEVVDRHRHDGARDALAGREQHVELARSRGGRDLVRERDQRVGRLAHRRDRADDAQARCLGLDETPCDGAHLLGVGHGRPAELHHDGVEGVRRARHAAVPRPCHQAVAAAREKSRIGRRAPCRARPVWYTSSAFQSSQPLAPGASAAVICASPAVSAVAAEVLEPRADLRLRRLERARGSRPS